MIVLDTNVISEPMRGTPDEAVLAWLNGQAATALYTTSINVMELRFGLERLPEGRRKSDLWQVLDFTLARQSARPMRRSLPRPESMASPSLLATPPRLNAPA